MNRLVNSKNLYLSQHAQNPIFWQPWDDKALEEARQRNCPIFLSIGYSSCHWCHVMARESFMDKEIASWLNKYFVCIKVDREERMDLDSLYMDACYILNGYGGWPLNLFLTPDKKPFLAFTYLPKENSLERLGFKELVKRISLLWQKEESLIQQSAQEVESILNKKYQVQKIKPTGKELELAREELKQNFDFKWGGFGKAPKFPLVPYLLFLASSKSKGEFLSMLELTLDNLLKGGIFDHLGGGFFRYSIDQKWQIPHFEKMLYDQALNIIALIQGYKLVGKEEYLEAANKTFSFCINTLKSSKGGFYTSINAESEGEEGKYYLWEEEELKNSLSCSEFEYLKKVSKIALKGNFKEEKSNKYIGKNILFIDIPEFDKKRLEPIFSKLLGIREKRKHPEIDKKILCDYNSLFLVALCDLYEVYPQKEILEEIKNLFFFCKNTFFKRDTLYHSFLEDELGSKATAYDYSYFIWSLTRVYLLLREEELLSLLKGLIEDFLVLFDYPVYLVEKENKELFLRPRQIIDSTLPSCPSVSVLNLLNLYKITEDKKYLIRAEKIIECLGKNFLEHPVNHCFLLYAFNIFNVEYKY